MYRICIDLGGSKCAVGLLKSSAPYTCIYNKTYPVHKGIPAIQKLIKLGIENARLSKEAKNHKIEPRIALGTPGMLIKKDGVRISKGSVNNLSTFPGEWDNKDLMELYKDCLPKGWTMTIENDALVQCKGAIHSHWEKANQAGTIMGYIGIGTGLGGAFAKIINGKIYWIGDGHIYDIMLKNGMAQDLISGRGFENVVQINPKKLNSTPINQDLNKIHQFTDNIVDLITEIQVQSTHKKDPNNNWSEKVQEEISNCRLFFLGGNIATQGPVGKIILNHVSQHFKTTEFIPISDPSLAAFLGLVLMD